MQLCLPSAVHSQLQFALKTASVMQANHRQEPSQMQILKDFSRINFPVRSLKPN